MKTFGVFFFNPFSIWSSLLFVPFPLPVCVPVFFLIVYYYLICFIKKRNKEIPQRLINCNVNRSKNKTKLYNNWIHYFPLKLSMTYFKIYTADLTFPAKPVVGAIRKPRRAALPCSYVSPENK